MPQPVTMAVLPLYDSKDGLPKLVGGGGVGGRHTGDTWSEQATGVSSLKTAKSPSKSLD